MLKEPVLNIVTRTSFFGHWLTRLQSNVGFSLLVHGKDQSTAEEQKLLQMALAGTKDPKGRCTEKPKSYFLILGPF